MVSLKKSKYKRILIKFSGEVLEGKRNHGIDFDYLKVLCAEIIEVSKFGVQIAIVIGGGNFWRYRDFSDSMIERTNSDYMGMIATIMNAVALESALAKMGVKARGFSALNFPEVLDQFTKRSAVEALEKGEIVICAGGTGNPFFTTDSAAALRGLELECEVLLKATNVDYVYDKDPKKFKGAVPFENVSFLEVLEKRLKVMDLSAIAMCQEGDLPIQVFNLTKKGSLIKAVLGEKVGTYISN